MYGGAGDASYTANTLAWVDSAALTLTAVKLSNKDKLTVELYLNAYYIAHVRYLQERDEVVLDNGGGGATKDVIETTLVNLVVGLYDGCSRSSGFINVIIALIIVVVVFVFPPRHHCPARPHLFPGDSAHALCSTHRGLDPP